MRHLSFGNNSLLALFFIPSLIDKPQNYMKLMHSGKDFADGTYFSNDFILYIQNECEC